MPELLGSENENMYSAYISMWLMGTGIALQFVGFMPKFYAMCYKLNSVGLEGDPVPVPLPATQWFGVTKYKMGEWVGLTFGSLSLYLFPIFSYLWGVLKWNESRIKPTNKTMFRSWMVNFLNFWIALATTVINFAITWSYFIP